MVGELRRKPRPAVLVVLLLGMGVGLCSGSAEFTCLRQRAGEHRDSRPNLQLREPEAQTGELGRAGRREHI